MTRTILLLAFALPLAAQAQETRELGAHEHGHSRLDIAVEGGTVSMALEAPGADIVGFEYEAEADADKATVDAALAQLSDPLSLFSIPEAAGCAVTEASAELVAEEHDHEADDHAEGEDHAEEDASDDHADGAKGDEEDARHSEFRAAYVLDCADPSAIDTIGFGFFALFENAREVDVQVISETGSQGFEVTRDAPSLDLSGAL